MPSLRTEVAAALVGTKIFVVGGIEPASRGEVRLDGQPVIADRRHQRHVGVVFQEDRLLPWLSAAGGRASLELFASLGVERIAAHNLALATALTGELGLPDAVSPIVRIHVEDAESAAERLRDAGIACSARGGSVRLSFHLYNDETDVDRALAALAPTVSYLPRKKSAEKQRER